MISDGLSEVQRTLVKSPPELWAELSDPVSLARHLSALGEIRITHVQLEERVEWEAGETTGAISIKPSGWGTEVTLSVTRETGDALCAPDRRRGDRHGEQRSRRDDTRARDGDSRAGGGGTGARS